MSATPLRLASDKWPIAGIVLGLIISGVLSFISFARIADSQEHAAWVGHTHRVRYDLRLVASSVNEAQSAVRGFAISGRADFLTPYQQAARELPPMLTALRHTVADNPAQVENLATLGPLMAEFFSLMDRNIDVREGSVDAAPVAALIREGQGNDMANRIRVLLTTMEKHEAGLLVQREAKMSAGTIATQRMLIGGTAAAFMVFCVAFLLLKREIVQRRRTDQALTSANASLAQRASELEEANKEMESFSYSVSHDLRIPLRAVSGYSAMLTEDYEALLDDEGKRLLNVIRENSKRMGVLIDDLLAFSRLGRQTLNAIQLDMHALVEQIVDEIRQRYPNSNAMVTLAALPPGCGDKALLRQVWINLIANAFKYSDKQPQPEIHISGTSEGGICTYSVRDNGVGFDMQYYEKLFGVFQRLHSAEEFPGTGVGLAIVQRVVLRHGGRIWAESALNQGSTFSFTLPHKDAP